MDCLELVLTGREIQDRWYVSPARLRWAVKMGRLDYRRSGGTMLYSLPSVILCFGQPILRD
jgi:hypothetical protein